MFSYRAVTSTGEVREGEQSAQDEAALVHHLQQQGLILLSVNAPGQGAGIVSTLLSPAAGNRLKHRELQALTQDLATLLQAGITLDRAFDIMLKARAHASLTPLISELQTGVRRGKPLSEVLQAQGGFSRFYISMVQAAEASGNLGPGLAELAAYLERARALREQTLSALLYPIILLLVSVLSLVIILAYVVPQFEQMFADMGQQLPFATRMVIASANVVQTGLPWVLLITVLLWVWHRRALAGPGYRQRYDSWRLQLPLYGAVEQRLETARLSRSLGTLLGAGVPLLKALSIARETLSNQALKSALEEAAVQVKEGRRLAEQLQQSERFPPLALQMMQVGEETGQLEPMLLKVAEIYDREVAVQIRRMLTILEPVLIVGLGVIIAAIILSILMAIISINELPV